MGRRFAIIRGKRRMGAYGALHDPPRRRRTTRLWRGCALLWGEHSTNIIQHHQKHREGRGEMMGGEGRSKRILSLIESFFSLPPR
jgi:hypothetical protein